MFVTLPKFIAMIFTQSIIPFKSPLKYSTALNPIDVKPPLSHWLLYAATGIVRENFRLGLYIFSLLETSIAQSIYFSVPKSCPSISQSIP